MYEEGEGERVRGGRNGEQEQEEEMKKGRKREHKSDTTDDSTNSLFMHLLHVFPLNAMHKLKQ